MNCQRSQIISGLEKKRPIDTHHEVISLEDTTVRTMVGPIADAGSLGATDTHERRDLGDDRLDGRIQGFDILQDSSISNIQLALLIELREARHPNGSD